MRKPTQRYIVEKYLQSLNGAWVERGELANLNTAWGFLPVRGADKTIREMLKKNREEEFYGRPIPYKIEQKIENKNGKPIAWVRAIQPKQIMTYKVAGTNQVVAQVPLY